MRKGYKQGAWNVRMRVRWVLVQPLQPDETGERSTTTVWKLRVPTLTTIFIKVLDNAAIKMNKGKCYIRPSGTL